MLICVEYSHVSVCLGPFSLCFALWDSSMLSECFKNTIVNHSCKVIPSPKFLGSDLSTYSQCSLGLYVWEHCWRRLDLKYVQICFYRCNKLNVSDRHCCLLDQLSRFWGYSWSRCAKNITNSFWRKVCYLALALLYFYCLLWLQYHAILCEVGD